MSLRIILTILGVIGIVVALGVAGYILTRPIANNEFVLLQYSSPSHWQASANGPRSQDVNVSVNWTSSTPTPDAYLVIEEGGIVVFTGSLLGGAGSFESAGGPLTVSASGLSDPSVQVAVNLEWTAAPGLPTL